MSFGDNGATWEDQFIEDDEDRNHFVQVDGDVQRSKQEHLQNSTRVGLSDMYSPRQCPLRKL